MTDKDQGGQLGAAYGAKSSAEIASVYDTWAAGYDRQMTEFGYRHPAVGAALAARQIPAGAGPILDAGAGTGLLGELLAILGYPDLEALDISEGMLAIAARKGCYRALHRADLAGPLPLPDRAFAGVVSVGVFTTGHVGAEGIDELVRVTRPGGAIVLTCKPALWETALAARIAARPSGRSVTVAERTRPYISMPNEAGATPSFAVVLRVEG